MYCVSLFLSVEFRNYLTPGRRDAGPLHSECYLLLVGEGSVEDISRWLNNKGRSSMKRDRPLIKRPQKSAGPLRTDFESTTRPFPPEQTPFSLLHLPCSIHIAQTPACPPRLLRHPSRNTHSPLPHPSTGCLHSHNTRYMTALR